MVCSFFKKVRKDVPPHTCNRKALRKNGGLLFGFIILLSLLFQAVNAPHEKDLFCAVTHEKHISVGIQQAQIIV